MYKIAIVPGDGTGPEVTAEAVKVLRAAADRWGFTYQATPFDFGGDRYLRTGEVLPDGAVEELRRFDAILLGAIGHPDVKPGILEKGILLRLRFDLDLYINLRPVKLYPGVKSVLAGKGPAEIDFVVLRENSEGEYVDSGSRFHIGQPDEFALQTAIHTRRGVERILRFGFEMARARRQRLTMVTKSNAQRYAYVLWDEILEEVCVDYPDIEADKQHADACAMDFVRRPEKFDVVVASNLFGDLLTDLGGIIGGGLGMAPSTNTNPERKYPSMFEPVHGSAPDIAGQGIANPIAMIASFGMALQYSFGMVEEAQALDAAIAGTLADGIMTSDIARGGAVVGTAAMTDAILARLP